MLADNALFVRPAADETALDPAGKSVELLKLEFVDLAQVERAFKFYRNPLLDEGSRRKPKMRAERAGVSRRDLTLTSQDHRAEIA